jgi:multidrug efflux pump subunit AcrA (membrane-fusion protein)
VRWAVVAVVITAAALAGAAAVTGMQNLAPAATTIPTTRATTGDIDVRVHTSGELAPLRSMSLAAPSVGSMLQIVTLKQAGTVVKSGDVVLQFDLAEQQFNLQQAESQLAEAEQEIAKLRADTRVQRSEDQVALLHARHEVRRAEIEVSGNEFEGRIKAEKNILALEEARRALTQIESDVKTHADSKRAGLAVLEEKLSKAKIAAEFARKNIENMTVRAPLDGMVVIKQNTNTSGGFGYPGMTLPEFKAGDTVEPGTTVAEVVDLSEMEIKAKIAETDRGAVEAGGTARVDVEALPSTPLKGSSKGVGGVAPNAFWEPQTIRQFSASFSLAAPSPLLRPGMTARLAIDGQRLKGVTHLPRQVLFEKEGKPVVYVREGSQFTPMAVQVLRVTENRIVLKDFPGDKDVALVNPETGGPAQKPGQAPASSPGAGQ